MFSGGLNHHAPAAECSRFVWLNDDTRFLVLGDFFFKKHANHWLEGKNTF